MQAAKRTMQQQRIVELSRQSASAACMALADWAALMCGVVPNAD